MEQHHDKKPFVPSPWQLFFRLLVTVFLVEAAVMGLLMSIVEEHGVWVAIADATMLVVVSAPLLWYFMVRPLRGTAIAEHIQAATIVEHSVDGIITANEKGLVESFNPAAEAIFGYRTGEVSGKSLILLTPERYRQAYCQALKRARSTGESSLIGKTVELCGLRKDGSEFPFEISLTAWKIGTRTTYAAIVRDITERKQADQNLQSRYRELETLYNISRTILDSLDLRAIMEGILDRAFEMGGFDVGLVRVLNAEEETLEPVASRGYRDAKNIPGQAKKILSFTTNTGTPRVLEAKSVQVMDLTQTSGMRTLRAEGVRTVVIIPLQSVKGVLGIIHLGSRTRREFQESDLRKLDAIGRQAGIAIQKAQLYEETRKQAAELEKANQMQADFTAMIAHDLRSPLVNIIGTADMMAEGLLGPVNEEQKEWLLRLQANGRCLVDLVSDFLDVSKIESGCIDITKEKVDLRQLIKNSMENYLPLARRKNLSLTTAVHPAVPKIEADPRRLNQVLSNLLSNAVKFTPDGGHIELGAAELNGTQVGVWVKDNGVGIPTENIGDLFEKYRQLKGAKVSHHQGTGLGLVICKKIVEAHEGKIWVESKQGVGATFAFTLPLRS